MPFCRKLYFWNVRIMKVGWISQHKPGVRNLFVAAMGPELIQAMCRPLNIYLHITLQNTMKHRQKVDPKPNKQLVYLKAILDSISAYVEPSLRDGNYDWLVGCFGFNGPLRVFQSISGRLPKRGRKGIETIEESKNVQTTPTRTYCKHSRPLPYCYPNCRTPRHWKFTQHHRTTRPSPGNNEN